VQNVYENCNEKNADVEGFTVYLTRLQNLHMLACIVPKLSIKSFLNENEAGMLTSAFGLSKTQQLLAVLNDVAILLPVFLLIFTWRGFFQAFTAKIMGDNSAQRDGFLSINPLAHIDLTGLLVVIGVFFFIGGLFANMMPRSVLLMLLILLGVRWTIPVTVDATKFKNYRLGGIITSLSGPCANVILAFMGVGLLRICFAMTLPQYALLTLVKILQTLIDITLFFGVLDLIPLPPFDGGRAIGFALPSSKKHIMNWLEEHAFYIFLILFFLPGVSDVFLGGISVAAMSIKKLMLMLFF
jgi:Zn-dependent protease